jgi:predicted DNA-binding transcriptional regulator AlpA
MTVEDRLVDVDRVIAITGLHKTAIYKRVTAGEFRPVKLGRKTVFSEQEIYQWVADQLAARPRSSDGNN